jgi:hypothetical protein
MEAVRAGSKSSHSWLVKLVEVDVVHREVVTSGSDKAPARTVEGVTILTILGITYDKCSSNLSQATLNLINN